MAFFLISGLSIYGFFCRRCAPPSSLIKADLYINSMDLSRAFETNEELSDSLYLYKVLSVRGAVGKIVKREAGNYVITLGDRGSGKSAVDCSLDSIYNRRALSLNPQYADAHFNLALLCERQGDTMRAVHHWKAYLKLDNSGQWADIARRQLERLRQAVIR